MEYKPEPVQDFCAKIAEDSDKEVSSIIERAEHTSKSRADQIMKEAFEKRDSIIYRAKMESETVRRHVLSDLNLEIRKVELGIKGEIIDDAFNKLRKRLDDFRQSPDYQKFLAGLAAEGIAVLNTGEVVLKFGTGESSHINSSLLDLIREKTRDYLGRDVRVETDSEQLQGRSGVQVLSSSRNVLFDNTIESRLNRMKDDLRLLISKVVFE